MLQVAPQRAREPAARWCWSSWTSGCRALPTRGRWRVHRHHEHQCGRPSLRRAALPRRHHHRAEPARCPSLPEHRPQRAHGCVRAPSLTRPRTAHGTRPVPRRQSNPSTRAWCAAASPGATPPTPPRNPYFRVTPRRSGIGLSGLVECPKYTTPRLSFFIETRTVPAARYKGAQVPLPRPGCCRRAEALSVASICLVWRTAVRRAVVLFRHGFIGYSS